MCTLNVMSCTECHVMSCTAHSAQRTALTLRPPLQLDAAQDEHFVSSLQALARKGHPELLAAFEAAYEGDAFNNGMCYVPCMGRAGACVYVHMHVCE